MWYETAGPEVKVRAESLAGAGGDMMELVAQAQKELDEWKERVLGAEKGEFWKHVGKEGNVTGKAGARKENFTDGSGSGQMGMIMLDIRWNDYEESLGWAELAKPDWDQKLWSGECALGFEAPTLRTVATVAAAVAATVVATVVTAGAASPVAGALAASAASSAITVGNELVFAMADYNGGYRSAYEIGKGLGTSLATSALSAAGGAAGAAVKGIGGVGGVALRTGISSSNTIATQAASTYISSGGDAWAVKKSFDSVHGWSGVISSTAGSLVTNSMNSINLGAGNIKVYGFNSGQIGSISSLNSTLGSLASTAVTYGLTGEATFNVLNIADFISSDSKFAGASSGLLEVTIGGKKGFSSRIGTGGADISMGNLKTALSGINNLNMNSKIKKAAEKNEMQNAATALRMQYGFGDETQQKLLNDVLNGDASLKRGSGNGDAQTVDVNGKRMVYLNNYKDDMTREEKLAMGITLGHEAYRDGVVGSKNEQINETIDAVLGHTTMAKRVQNDSAYKDIMNGIISGNQNLKKDIEMFDEAVKNKDFSSFGEYVLENYDYSADYWLLKTDGTIVWDGSKDLNVEYYDKDGNIQINYDKDGDSKKDAHIKDETGSFSQSLLNYVGEERALRILSKAAGKEITGTNNFPEEVILSVTGMSAETLQYLKENHPVEYQQIFSSNKDKLIAEGLMYNQGMSWKKETGWTGDFSSLKMSDYDIGQIVINPIYDSNNNIIGYDRFGITAEVYRDERSYSSTRNNTVKDFPMDGKQGLDSIYLYKKDLNGNILDSTIYDPFSQGWQTVANGFSDPDMDVKAYPSFNIKDGYNVNVYRGSTVVENQSFYMRFGNFTSNKFGGNIFQINRAQTLSEGMANLVGLTVGSSDPIEGHSNWLKEYGRADNWGLVSASCFMNNIDNLNDMNKWVVKKVPYSYDVKAIVYNKKNFTGPVYGPVKKR